jgi:hypothetical protein
MMIHRRKKKVALALEFRMFPRSEEKLSFLKIAEYWSREIRPLASRDELLAILEAAWWRGELIGKSPRTRLQLLQIMFGFRESPPYQGIVFVTPNDPGRPAVTELKNGEVGVDQSPRINVPCEAEDWTEDSCATAFSGLAEASSRKHFPIVSPVLCSIEVAREDFFQWVEARGFVAPKFWKRIEAVSADRPGDAQDLDRGKNKAGRGKVPPVLEWLAKRFPNSRVPEPAIAPRQLMLRDVIKDVPALGNGLSDDTLRTAIKRHDEQFPLENKATTPK